MPRRRRNKSKVPSTQKISIANKDKAELMKAPLAINTQKEILACDWNLEQSKEITDYVDVTTFLYIPDNSDAEDVSEWEITQKLHELGFETIQQWSSVLEEKLGEMESNKDESQPKSKIPEEIIISDLSDCENEPLVYTHSSIIQEKEKSHDKIVISDISKNSENVASTKNLNELLLANKKIRNNIVVSDTSKNGPINGNQNKPFFKEVKIADVQVNSHNAEKSLPTIGNGEYDLKNTRKRKSTLPPLNGREKLSRSCTKDNDNNSTKTFDCYACGKIYSKRSSLLNHLQICRKIVIVENEYFHCKFCEYKTPKKHYLRLHLSNKHTHSDLDANGFATCEKCGKTYNGMTQFRMHKRLCGQPAHLKCKFCNYWTKQKYLLKQHVNRVHKDKIANTSMLEQILKECSEKGNRRIKKDLQPERIAEVAHNEGSELMNALLLNCPKCKITIPRQSLGNTNCSQCDKQMLDQCSTCGKRYISYEAAKHHLLNSFRCLSRDAYHCYHCNYKTDKKTDITNHLEKTHGFIGTLVMDEEHRCNKCDKTFKSIETFQRHQQTVCNNPTYIQCEFCGIFGAKQQVSLKIHITKRHMVRSKAEMADKSNAESEAANDSPDKKNVIKLDCQRCLITDQPRIVDGKLIIRRKCPKCDDPIIFRCNKKNCSRTYRRLQTLQKHIKRPHDGQERFQCPLCRSKYFNLRSELTKHKIQCGMNRLLRCDDCDFSINYEKWLRHLGEKSSDNNVTITSAHHCYAREMNKNKRNKTNVSIDKLWPGIADIEFVSPESNVELVS